MSAISSVGDDFTNTESLPYDSMLYKFFCCVPIVGTIANLIIDSKIRGQIARSTDVPRLVRWIDLKNDFKIAAVIRNILSAILPILGVFGFLFLVPAALNYASLNHNQRIIQELVNTGYRPGLEVH